MTCKFPSCTVNEHGVLLDRQDALTVRMLMQNLAM